jgi:hypothetical protein
VHDLAKKDAARRSPKPPMELAKTLKASMDTNKLEQVPFVGSYTPFGGELVKVCTMRLFIYSHIDKPPGANNGSEVSN